MENEAVYTEKYKNCKIKIYQDIDCQGSPNDEEYDAVFLVAFHRDFDVRRDDIITKDEAIEISTGEYDKENGLRSKEIEKKYYTFGLEAYIHSGITLALSYEGNFCDRNWDVSQLGMVLVARTEAKTRHKAKELARKLIETWNDNLSGNVYGFITRDEFNNDIESCWGFYGYYEKSGIIEEAKKRIDYYVKEELPKVKREVIRQELYKRHDVNLLDLKNNQNETIKRVAISLIKLLKIK